MSRAAAHYRDIQVRGEIRMPGGVMKITSDHWPPEDHIAILHLNDAATPSRDGGYLVEFAGREEILAVLMRAQRDIAKLLADLSAPPAHSKENENAD